MNKIIRKKFVALWGLGLIGVVAILPYTFSLQAEAISEAGIPLPALVFVSLIQSSILVAIVVFLGMKLSARTGFQTPLIDAVIAGQPLGDISKLLKVAAISGILVAVAITSLEFVFKLLIPALGTLATPPLWQGLLASLYGGITEELIIRYFLMSLVVFVLLKIRKRSSQQLIIGAIFGTAIIFGLLHLPAMAALVDLTPLIILRTVVLNSIGGIVFGYFYWKHGLEYAMVSHFTADIFLQTISRVL